MKRLTLTSILSLLALAAAASLAGRAAPPASQCPAVKVSCPDTLGAGEEAVFTAEVAGAAAASTFKPSFKWEASAGSVVSGQGTASFKVDTTGLSQQTVTATVEVEGFSPVCERKASCTTLVAPVIIGCGFDEYGNIKFDDEKARLDNFAIELQNDLTAQGHMICYGGRTGYEGEALRRCERAKNYLSGVRGIEAARIVIIDGGFREELTVELWAPPRGSSLPAASPTVDPSEVTFIRDAPKRKHTPRGARRH